MGEAYAERLYEKQGYRILEKNYYVRGGEIDLIAENGEYIVFCEVKLRDVGSLGVPAETVTRQKQRRIIHAALCYLGSYDVALQPRFDVVAITSLGGKILSHEWIEDAFSV